MKFKFIYLPDDNPDDPPRACESGAAEPASPAGALRYENDGTDMVRREQSANGRSRRTAVANFKARIVSDMVLDDGTAERREFGVEMRLSAHRLNRKSSHLPPSAPIWRVSQPPATISGWGKGA